jgi:hypothetical protein
MHFATTLAILASLTTLATARAVTQDSPAPAPATLDTRATIEARKCYKDWDQFWPADKKVYNDTIEAICNGDGVSGSFKGKEEKRFCWQEAKCEKCTMNQDKYRLNAIFAVKWTKGTESWLGDEDCKMRLRNELEGCSSGGRQTTANWYFK